MPRTLPPELTDYIIDFAWDDPPTLRSCALTCRAWRAASELHLAAYHGLRLWNVADLALASKRVARPESRRFLRVIEVMGVRESSERPFVHTVPLCIPGLFVPRLRSIAFSNIGFCDREVAVAPAVNWHPSFFSLLSSYKSVTDLIIGNSRFRDWKDLGRIVGALSALKNVDFNGLRFLGPPPGARPSLIQDPGRPRRRPSLLQLKFTNSVSEGHAELLDCLQLFSGVEGITTEAGSGAAVFPRGNMAVARFPVSRLLLKAFVLGRALLFSLHRFRLNTEAAEALGIRSEHALRVTPLLDTLAADATSLVRNIHLETIEYSFAIVKDYTDFRSTIQAITTMLSQGVGEKVTKIHIYLQLKLSGLDDFLPYEHNEGPAPSLDLAPVRFGLQNVIAVELVIQMFEGVYSAPWPPRIIDAAIRIISPLFAHWDARGMFSAHGRRAGQSQREGVDEEAWPGHHRVIGSTVSPTEVDGSAHLLLS